MTIFLEWTKNRIRKGFSPIILIVGKQRSGKTCLALLFAHLLDKDFDPEKQMFFDVVSYAKAVNRYRRKVLILDEAGIQLDSYRYNDTRQRAFSHIIQSQAYKQNTLLLCLPMPQDLAKCHRRNIDAYIIVPRRGQYIFGYPYLSFWNLNEMDMRAKKIEHIFRVPLPPAYLYDAYKKKFETQIKQGILQGELEKLDKFIQDMKPKPNQAYARLV